jgi:hypothetical protein
VRIDIAMRCSPSLFNPFEAASDTLVGIELMQLITKKQRRVETGDEGLTAAE